MSFEWAQPYPDIHKICVLFNRTELQNPIKWKYLPLSSYLQNGPQCGLVALAMLMGQPCKDTVDLLFKYAHNLGFTFNGEIFSCDYMQSLANEFLKNVTTEIYTGSINSSKIKDLILSGGCLLVPYDTNKDNSPGLHGGHKAHWCVISGAVYTGEDFYVFARHGKARNVAIWPLHTLALSNQQLLEFSLDRQLQEIKYKLPEGGIKGPLGLNNRCILIYDS